MEKLSINPTCGKCRTEMIVREGPYGKFWACPSSTPKDPHPTRSLASRKKSRLFFVHWGDDDNEWGTDYKGNF